MGNAIISFARRSCRLSTTKEDAKMRQFFRNDRMLKKCLFISYVVLGLLIITGLFSRLNSYNARSSTEDLFDKRFKIYQSTATAIRNVSNIHLNLDKATRQANAGFDEKEINLLVRKQLAALDETNMEIKQAFTAEWLTPVEKRLCDVVLKNFRDYKESYLATLGLGTPGLKRASLSVGIFDDFAELSSSLYDLLALEEKLSQGTSDRRPRSLRAALGNLYPTFESSHRTVHADQPSSRQAHYRSYR